MNACKINSDDDSTYSQALSVLEEREERVRCAWQTEALCCELGALGLTAMDKRIAFVMLSV